MFQSMRDIFYSIFCRVPFRLDRLCLFSVFYLRKTRKDRLKLESGFGVLANSIVRRSCRTDEFATDILAHSSFHVRFSREGKSRKNILEKRRAPSFPTGKRFPAFVNSPSFSRGPFKNGERRPLLSGTRLLTFAREMRDR